MDISKSHDHEKHMIENIYEHYKNKQLCDVVLISELNFFFNFTIAGIYIYSIYISIFKHTVMELKS